MCLCGGGGGGVGVVSSVEPLEPHLNSLQHTHKTENNSCVKFSSQSAKFKPIQIYTLCC